MDKFVPETGRDLIAQRIPDLRSTGQATTTSSLHNVTFVGKSRHWARFQHEVAELMESLPWTDSIQSVRPRTHDIAPNFITFEQYNCGDEQSVCGRFTQNVLHVATAVARELGIAHSFGDFKCSIESAQNVSKIPDFVALDGSNVIIQNTTAEDQKGKNVSKGMPPSRGQKLSIVGEAKTPWVSDHDLFSRFQPWLQGDEKRFREVVGQIAEYMHVYKAKYGFLTTYDQTIFFKQEQDQNSNWMLSCSDPILHTAGVDVYLEASTSKRSHKYVSVCESMLYLMSLAKDNDARLTYKDELHPIQQWVDCTKLEPFQSPATPEAVEFCPHCKSPIKRPVTNTGLESPTEHLSRLRNPTGQAHRAPVSSTKLFQTLTHRTRTQHGSQGMSALEPSSQQEQSDIGETRQSFSEARQEVRVPPRGDERASRAPQEQRATSATATSVTRTARHAIRSTHNTRETKGAASQEQRERSEDLDARQQRRDRRENAKSAIRGDTFSTSSGGENRRR